MDQVSIWDKQKWIVQYKSIAKFEEKLNQIKEPQFELQSFQEIDDKFKNMCKSYSEKITQNIVNYQKRPGIKTKKLTFIKQIQEIVNPIHQNQRRQASHFNNNNKTISNITPRGAIRNSIEQEKYFEQINRISQPKQVSSKRTIQLSPDKKDSIKELDSHRSQQSSEFLFTKKNVILQQQIQLDKEEQKMEEQISNSYQWKMIQKEIQGKIKQQDKPEPMLNPLVKMFGSNCIGIVFQALVVKKIEELFRVKLNMDSGMAISDKLLQIFGINQSFLSSLNSQKLKIDYIMQTMNARVELLVQDWQDKKRQREQVYKQKDKNKNYSGDDDSTDQLYWIKIESKFDSLKKKLRAAIIERMNDYENQLEIFEKLNKNSNQNLPNNNGENSYRETRRDIVLSGIQFLSTSTLLCRLNPKEGKLLQQLEEKQKKKMGLKRSSAPNIKSLKNNEKEAKEKEKEEQIDQQIGSNQQQDIIDNKSKQIDIKKSESKKEFQIEWTDELEIEFQTNKQEAKGLYFDDVTTSDWYELGFLPLVQQYNLENKHKQQREVIFQKYMEGEWLTADELKFLADTSKLLNSCIDKKHVQRTVNHLDPEVLQMLELNLAENIIKNYEDMKTMIRIARFKYLKKKSLELGIQTLKKQQEWNYQAEIERKKKSHEAFQKAIQRRVERMYQKKPELLVAKKNFFVKIFVQNMKYCLEVKKKYLKYKEEEQRQMMSMQEKEAELKQLQQMKQNQKSHDQKMAEAANKKKIGLKQYLLEKQHQLHPPSRIPTYPDLERSKNQNIIQLIDQEEDAQKILVEKRKEYMNQKVVDFKLGLRNKEEVRKPLNFQNFYSGGPVQKKGPIFKDQFYLTEKEIKGIILIQKVYRKFKLRNNIQLMKDNDYMNKYKDYTNKLNALLKGDYMNRITTKVKHIRQKRKLKQQNQQEQKTIINQSTLQQTTGKKNLQIELSPSNESQKQFDDQAQVQYSQNQQTTPQSKQSVYVKKSYIQSAKPQTNQLNQSKQSDLGTTVSIHQNTTSGTDRTYISHSQIQSLHRQYKPATPIMKTEASNESINGLTPKNQLEQWQVLLKDQEQAKKYNINTGFVGPRTTRILHKHMVLLSSAKQNNFQNMLASAYLYDPVDLRQLDKDRKSALYYVARHKNFEFAQWLLSKGADPNQQCQNGDTPTHIAFQSGSEQLIGLLLSNNADLNIINQNGITPLGYASPELLKKLDLQNAIILTNSSYGRTYFNNNTLLKRTVNAEQMSGGVQKYAQNLQINNFYPLKSPTILLNEQKSE